MTIKCWHFYPWEGDYIALTPESVLACEGVMSQFWDVPVRGLTNFILVSSVPKLSHMKSKHLERL